MRQGEVGPLKRRPRRWPWVVLVLLTASFLFCYTQLTLFVVQPIGAIPEGVTVVVWRREKTRFIDSADAFCLREMGGVSLFCRGGAIAGIARGDIIMRLPYWETLYLISTDGQRFDR